MLSGEPLSFAGHHPSEVNSEPNWVLKAMAKVEVVPESDSLALRRTEKGSHDWEVRNYSILKGIGGVDRAIESDDFTVGGHCWVLRLFPDGKTDEAYKARNASLFITLKDDDNDSCSDPVQFLLDMYLVNQSANGGPNYRGPLGPDQKVLVNNLPCEGFLNCGHIHFIKRKILESPEYLKDDCLKFHCNVTVFTRQIRVSLPSIKVPGSNIGAHLGKLLESEEGADVFFSVKGARFSAHKWILSARSHVFRSMLLDQHPQPQQIIAIPDMEPKIFKAMLRFIYTGNLKQEEEEVVSDSSLFMHKSFVGRMLAAADQFDLKKLKKMCESRISGKLSGESAAYLLQLADLHHAMDLKDACLRFAAENRDVVLESDGCEYLKETCPLLFLEIAYSENPCSSGELNFCSRLLSALKGPLVGMFSRLGESDEEHKTKEA